jgi:hypothetical protein
MFTSRTQSRSVRQLCWVRHRPKAFVAMLPWLSSLYFVHDWSVLRPIVLQFLLQLSFPKSPHWLCGPPALLFSGYRERFSQSWGVKLTTYLRSNTEVKNAWIYAVTPTYSIKVCTGQHYLAFLQLNLTSSKGKVCLRANREAPEGE